MPTSSHPTRRRFLQSSLAASASLLPQLSQAADPKKKTPLAPMSNPVCVFNKPLQHLSYEEQASLVAEMGFAGIEGTVRTGGHVEAKNVERDLPKQIAALQKHNIEMTLMTTKVNNIDDPLNRTVIKTAAKLGVKRFRMGAYRYDLKKPIPEQVESFRHTYRELIRYCADLDIQPLYQNHAGAKYFGATLWDLHLLMKGENKEQTGICFDIRHATAESGLSWPLLFQLTKPHFKFVYCKDFDWDKKTKRATNVPLGTGMVDYPKFFSMLRKINYSDPISLHMEYKDHRDPKLLQESIAAVRQDHQTLLKFMGKA
ncbi:MAG: sugar phosphate isomerase/epimerase [Verrucomicrobiales bacterium]|nr:sugar phosphate isomerase/epimerase [Verrucomicrobiales bacterium]